MLRLLLFCLISLSFFSCEEVYTQDDELFYQISEADSTRCMEEILDGMLEEASEEQKWMEQPVETCWTWMLEEIKVSINSVGQVMIQNELVSDSISEKVYDFFMFNRSLTSKETMSAVTNINHPGFDFPFYNHFNMEEIEEMLDHELQKWEEIRSSEGVDSLFEEYYYSKAEEWRVKKSTLDIIGDSELPEISQNSILVFLYQHESEKSKEVLMDIAFAFYQMRNYECLRYFGETYLQLYERAQRLNLEKDKEKLKALKVMHPARFYSFEGREPWYVVEIPPEQLP